MQISKTFLDLFEKIVQGHSPQHLIKFLRSNCASNYQIQTADKNNYKNRKLQVLFHSFYVREWNNLGNFIRKAKSMIQFTSTLMQFFTLKQRSLFSIHDQKGIKYLQGYDGNLVTYMSINFLISSKIL